MIKSSALWCALLCTLFSFTANATIIIPFDDLGHLTEESTEIVIATVTKDHFYESDEMINYSWSLEVQKGFKNILKPGESLYLSAMSSKSTNLIHKVLGDIQLELGKTYMLFLNYNDNTLQWQPMTMGMYVYEQRSKAGGTFYVPTMDAMDVCKWGDDEPQFVMEATQLESYMQSYVSSNYQFSWNDNKLKSDIALEEFHPQLKAPPSECVFLFDGASGCGVTYDGVRWQAFPDDEVEVHIDVEQQYTDSDNEVSDALSDMDFEYEGINLTDEGIVSSNFTPTCTDAFGGAAGVASSSNFSSYCNGLNGGDNFLVVFNDPCDEISAMSGCSGTLAIGGLFAGCGGGFSDNHDGGDWLRASNGYIVVNQGAECLSLNDFKIMLTHEMTHSLGFGHILASNGTANMNPSCCNDIASLDVECLDYLYEPAAAVPVTWNTVSVSDEARFNLIQWSTSNEINNEYFIIEKSYNAVDFDQIGRVHGSINSSVKQSYSFEDDQFNTTTTFYRIKQIDYDGNYSYSDIVSVSRDDRKEGVKLFPNPANETLFLNIDAESRVTITDVLGNQQNVLISKSNLSFTSLDIAHLSSGVYYIEIDNDQKKEVKSFIKI